MPEDTQNQAHWTEWTQRLAGYYSALLKHGSGSTSRHLHKMSAAASRGYVGDLALFEIDGDQILSDSTIVLDLGEQPETEPEWEEEQEDTSQESPQEDGAPDEQGELAFLAGRERARSALMKIYKKQKTDPYNRETIFGYPLVAGKVGNKKVNGPLLFWEVEVRYDAGRQRLSLGRRSPNPSINNGLLSSFESDEAVIETLKEQLLPLLAVDQFGRDELKRTVDTVRGIVGPLKSMEVFEAGEAEGLREFLSLANAPGQRPVIAYWPVLINGPRTYAFLLEDLDKIAKSAETGASSVVSQIVGDIPEGIGEVEGTALPFEDSTDGGDPLWFPFESNRSQRRVAEASQRARVLTVQGPPGTGKSLTIANLVCDLATRGNSVLVTSHQTKALEVVANKLPAIEYLAMPVLRDDRESMAKLKAQLASTNVVANEPADEARRRLGAIEDALSEHDRELRRLTRRYSELKELEHEGYSDHSKYGDIRDLDRIDPNDGPFQRDFAGLAEALREWAGLVVQLRPALADLTNLFRPDDLNLTRAEESRLATALETVVRLSRHAGREPSPTARELLSLAREDQGAGADLASGLSRFGEWISGPAEAVLRHVRQESVSGSDDWRSWRDRSNAVPSEELDQLAERLEEAREYLETVDETLMGGTQEPDNLSVLQRAVSTLNQARTSFIRWHLTPSARRARKVLTGAGFVVSARGNAAKDLSEAGRVLTWFRKRKQIHSTLQQTKALVPEWKGSDPSAETPPLLAAAVRSAGRALNLVHDLGDAPLLSEARHPYPAMADLLTRDLSPEGRLAAEEAVKEAADRLALQGGAAELKKELRLGATWKTTVHSLLGALERGEAPPDEDFVRRLEVLVRAYPYFQRLVDLETTELANLSNTRRQILEHVRAEETAPEWLNQAETALDAHRLSSMMRQKLSANPDDLTEVSERLQEGQTRRRELIEEIIRRKRRLHVRQVLNEPRTSVPLRKLNKLLNRKRLTDSLVSLKKGIDYQAVLNVFPAWICTIDDAARLFPLEAGLFDYLIVDEASQCSQATALPLAYRAKRMIVVGDEEQLQPATSRFMKQANIDLLQREHRIVEHPQADALNGRDSLLQLAEHFKNRRVFLDEHFRCDPSIIRWSNHRFYNNQLKILTHRRADSFERALEVRELKDADEDREKKQNVQEAEAVVAEARRLIESGEAARMKIGLISPYRDQADLLQTLLLRRFEDRPEWLDEYGLVASTADGFQGDERDIILYSFRFGPSSSPHSVTTIQREYQRLNVAFTRAKRKGICFISSSISRFPPGHIQDFLNHAKAVENAAANGGNLKPDRPDHFDSEFERDVCGRFRDRGLKVSTQEPVAGFRIDLVIEDSEGRILGVECDGDWKHDDFGQLRQEDYQRQDIIERAGWTIHRISGLRYHLNPVREIDRAIEVLEQQRTTEERKLAIGPSRPSGPPRVEEKEPAEPPVVGEAPAAEAEPDKPQDPGVTGEDDGRSVPVEEAVPDLPPAIEPESKEKSDPFAFMGELKVDPKFAVKGMFRWYLRRNELEGAASDELNDILEEMQLGESLTGDQLDYLRSMWRGAIRRGFNPEDDMLVPIA